MYSGRHPRHSVERLGARIPRPCNLASSGDPGKCHPDLLDIAYPGISSRSPYLSPGTGCGCCLPAARGRVGSRLSNRQSFEARIVPKHRRHIYFGGLVVLLQLRHPHDVGLRRYSAHQATVAKPFHRGSTGRPVISHRLDRAPRRPGSDVLATGLESRSLQVGALTLSTSGRCGH